MQKSIEFHLSHYKIPQLSSHYSVEYIAHVEHFTLFQNKEFHSDISWRINPIWSCYSGTRRDILVVMYAKNEIPKVHGISPIILIKIALIENPKEMSK